jgi:hypothetical protein
MTIPSQSRESGFTNHVSGGGGARNYYDLFTMRPYELICDKYAPLIETKKIGW